MVDGRRATPDTQTVTDAEPCTTMTNAIRVTAESSPADQSLHVQYCHMYDDTILIYAMFWDVQRLSVRPACCCVNAQSHKSSPAPCTARTNLA